MERLLPRIIQAVCAMEQIPPKTRNGISIKTNLCIGMEILLICSMPEVISIKAFNNTIVRSEKPGIYFWIKIGNINRVLDTKIYAHKRRIADTALFILSSKMYRAWYPVCLI